MQGITGPIQALFDQRTRDDIKARTSLQLAATGVTLPRYTRDNAQGNCRSLDCLHNVMVSEPHRVCECRIASVLLLLCLSYTYITVSTRQR